MRIGIVGCGIGGMAAAIALAREGHGVTLFERFDAPAPVGAGLLLQPSGLQALGALGLRDEVEARGARRLADAGFVVDYAAIRTPDLAEPDASPAQYASPGPRVALVAARLGRTRLIDNVEFAVA